MKKIGMFERIRLLLSKSAREEVRAKRRALKQVHRLSKDELAELLRTLAILAISVSACGGEFTTAPNQYDGSAGMTGASGSPGSAGIGSAGGVGEGYQCNESVPCDDGLFCDDDGKCSLKSDIGGACSDRSECNSDRCVSSLCVEPVAPYDGPAWVECADGVLTARGFDGLLSQFEVKATVEFWGSEYYLYPSCTINDEYSEAASIPMWSTSVEGSTATLTSQFDEVIGENPETIHDVSMLKSSTLRCDFQWISELGSDLEPPSGVASIVRCMVSTPELEVAGAVR